MTPTIIGKAKLYNMDCMELLKVTPDKFYDLAIVDPPYGIGVSSQNNKKRGKLGSHYENKNWDDNAPNLDYFNELVRVSKNQIIWGANHFADRLPCPKSPCWIVWNKMTVGNTADCELAFSSFKTAVRRFDFMWEGFWQGDMKNKEKRIHPTQKPIKLYEWLLTNYAKQGDKILDTHGGSMSSVIACLNLGYEITCSELDSDYFKSGVERVNKSQQQLRMFA